MLHISGIATLVLYLCATILAAINIARAKGRTGKGWLVKAGFIAHTVSLVGVIRVMPALTSVGDYYFMLSWALVLVGLILWRKADPTLLGLFVVPLSLVFLASSSLLMHYPASEGWEVVSDGTYRPALLALHALPALLAEICLGVALIASAMYLFHQARLKRKKSTSVIVVGPSLDSLERWLKRSIAAGFFSMTLAILSGIIWAIGERQPFLGRDITQGLALIAWLLLAAIFYLGSYLSWSGHRLARITVGLTGMLLLTLLVGAFWVGSVPHNISTGQ